ncbi:MAG TPA: prepilin-type N-terminal cleavage/methylation domain-containing protein [Frankiaceae bacterium]|nr:prepilin-type N-terminal cleavage/methylation domain-containing protein [Frankiaceae bacterium]
MRNHQSDEGGFTLVELLVVAVIIGVLSSIAIPAFAAQTRKGKVASLRAALRSAATVQEQRIADDEPYAQAGLVGLAQLKAAGYVDTPAVELTVVDDDMTAGGRGYCLRASHASLPAADDLYLANTGPNAGRATSEPCVAS